MPVTNTDIEKALYELADILEIKGKNSFRVRAYRQAAQTVGSHSRSIKKMIQNGEDIKKLSGIGEDLKDQIEEMVETGRLKKLEKNRSKKSDEQVRMMSIPTLGPKKIKKLERSLGIKSIDALKKAAKEGRIQTLEGFGKKSEKSILKEISRLEKRSKRRLRFSVLESVHNLLNYLGELDSLKKIEVAGSFRRCKETVGDIDILVATDAPKRVGKYFLKYEDIEDVIKEGKKRLGVILKDGLQVDLRIVPPDSYGAALLYFTGSKPHNIALRDIAIQKGYKLNEYGLFKNDKKIASKKEEDIYKALELDFIPPELRESRGEIEAAKNGHLPELVKRDDIKGDLHIHTKYSDGNYTIEEMANRAIKLGYRYIAITDHSKKVAVANGMDEEELKKHIERINEADKKIKDIKILSGVEVDILKNGLLDLDDWILERVDVVVASVHFNMNLSRKKQTQRLIKAIKNPKVHILGHPSNRMIQERGPIEADWERIFEVCRDEGVALELNSSPKRLDIDDIYAKKAKEMGVHICLNTDSHTTDSLEFVDYGIDEARRGWLEKSDIINTKNLKELKKFLGHNG
ncbi:MAG: DNA polymerase/3'-5' exonuclease PolX [Campylobacterales bacterium]